VAAAAKKAAITSGERNKLPGMRTFRNDRRGFSIPNRREVWRFPDGAARFCVTGVANAVT